MPSTNKTDELDRYGINKFLRVKLYMGSLAMVITMLSIACWLLYKCVVSRDTLWQRLVTMSRSEANTAVDAADRKISPIIEDANRKNDSLSLQIDSLKKTQK